MDSVKKICVCSVQIPFVRGGAEYFSDNLASELLKRCFEVERVQLPFQTLPLEEVIKGCLAWRLLNLDRIYNEEIDLVIGTKFPSYLVPHKNKVIWLVHQYREIYDLHGTAYSGFQNTSRDNQIREHLIAMDRLAFAEAQKCFSISRTVAGRLKEYNGFDSVPLYPPLADSERFHFKSLEDYVLSVSRLEGNKRVHLFIESLQHISPQFKGVIVGGGFLRSDYERLASELGVSDRILFTGALARSDLIDLYSRAGAVFYGPIGEDYGYVTLEAFSSRKPVITCDDSGGILEFVDENSGWVAKPEPQSIAVCLQEALVNKELSRSKGEAGHQKIQHLNWDYVLDHLLS
jgi:glycosyltransferase involved in cell wall biosynthesis